MRELESDLESGGGQIMTYCTGGIRCEKGVRFLAERMEKKKGDKVSTLKGGIAAYLMWMERGNKARQKNCPMNPSFKERTMSLTREALRD